MTRLWEGGWSGRKSGDRSLAFFTRLRSEGNEGAIMPISARVRGCFVRSLPIKFLPANAAILIASIATVCPAASIRGVVTDPSGAKVSGANVIVLSNGIVVTSAVSSADGSYQVLTGADGRFFLVVSASTFRQVETPGFYAGRLDNIERNIVLEPEWVRDSIVVTATGTPTPQPQTSAAISVIGPADLALQENLVGALRLMPGTFVVQTGQRGAQSSLFVRGGDSDSTKILIDGIDAGDLGNQFSYGPLSTTAVESAEVYRGPNSNLYGAGAETGVVSLTTPHGTTSFPSLLFEGDAGNFNTSREQLEAAGAHNKLDYLGAFSWLQTGNALPNDEYHVATTAGNFGWQPSGTTQIRGTVHYGVDGTGVPNAWDFYHVADSATQKDQDLFISGSIDNQTTPDFHQSVRYGLTRKREQYGLWQQDGSGDFDAFGDSLGQVVTITGANGSSATGKPCWTTPRPIPTSILWSPIATNSSTRATIGLRRTSPRSSASTTRMSGAWSTSLPTLRTRLLSAPITTIWPRCMATSRTASSTRWAAAWSTIRSLEH